jgi:hypothetical protein
MNVHCKFNLVGVVTAILNLNSFGCGGKNAEPTTHSLSETGSPEDSDPREDGTSAARIEGVEATVNWDDVEKVFNQRERGLYDCYNMVVEEVEEIEGRVEFAVQVGDGGKVVDVNIISSNLGSLEAEKCMLSKIERFKFKLQGKGIAHFTKDMTLEAPYDPPKPMTWENQVVSGIIDEHRSDVERCLRGETGIELTLWVGRGGVVLSSGVATQSSDLKDEAYCLAEACRRWTFPDPGGEVAKVERKF